MRNKKYTVLAVLIAVTLTLGGCAEQSTRSATSPTAFSATATASLPPSPTPTITATLVPAATSTPKSSETPPETLPDSTLMFLGTQIPGGNEEISSQNINRLTPIAQWGRGTISGAAFTPDGSQFVIGSAFGFAIYNIHDLQSSPTWVPLNIPIAYSDLVLSQDGKYLRLGTGNEKNMILDFPTGRVASDHPDLKWEDSVTRSGNQGEMVVDSPDGTKQLKAHTILDQNVWEIKSSVREIYDTKSGDLISKLPDETFYVRYNDVHQPEGCDISSTNMCGNAYSPNAFAPYEAAFSPSGDTLTILYRAPNYGNTNHFSVLRVYDVKSGMLKNMVGNFKKPIQTFAYEPSSTRLLIAFVDGSIQLRDIYRNEPTAGAWHFNNYLTYAEFTSNGQFLLLKRPDLLEVRSTQEGSLRSRFDAVSYSLSPVDSNIIAIADSNNTIKVMKLDSGDTLLTIPAHDYPIFTVAFSPDGKYIASSGEDCKIKLWDAKTGEFIHYFEDTRVNPYMGGPVTENVNDGGNSRVFIYYMRFIKGTNQIVGFGSWGTMVNWNVNSGATNYVVYSTQLQFYGSSINYPDSFGVDTANQQFFIGDKIYNLNTGKLFGDYAPPQGLPEDCAPSGAKSTDGNLLFTLGYESLEGKICVLDVHDYHLVQVITVIPDADYDFTVAGLSLSQDGKTLIIATTLGTVNIYQVTP